MCTKEDFNRIYALLEKYLECSTSIDDERELRYFFMSNDVPPDLRPYKIWFLSQGAEDLYPLGSDFDQQVLEKIRNEKRRQYCRYIINLTGIATLILMLTLLILCFR